VRFRRLASDKLLPCAAKIAECVGNHTDKPKNQAAEFLQAILQEAFVGRVAGASFDPETIELMGRILENAAAMLPTHLRTTSVRTELAELIRKAAAAGERDPMRLRTAALIAVMARYRPFLTGKGTLQL
jgi:hypothetical protein